MNASVSLVDPRVSRDGVPLCAEHADTTTPPLGWSMNDLRSTAKALGLDGDVEPVVTTTPPRVRPSGEGLDGGHSGPDGSAADSGQSEPETATARRMSRRQSIIERARQGSLDLDDHQEPATGPASGSEEPRREAAAARLGRDETDREANERFIARSLERRRSGRRGTESAPESRPTRRREVAEEEPQDDEVHFPWHHTFNDDEPVELQASTPLLSRAFRSTTG